MREKVPDHNVVLLDRRRKGGPTSGRRRPGAPGTHPALVDRLANATAPAYGWAETTAVACATGSAEVEGDPRSAQLVAVQFRDLDALRSTS